MLVAMVTLLKSDGKLLEGWCVQFGLKGRNSWIKLIIIKHNKDEIKTGEPEFHPLSGYWYSVKLRNLRNCTNKSLFPHLKFYIALI